MRRKVWVGIGIIFAALIAAGLWITLPPIITRELPIASEFLSWLKGPHPPEVAGRLSDPLEVCLQMLFFKGDAIDTEGMKISVRTTGEEHRLVTIDDTSTEDDSVTRSYYRIRLVREGLSWRPSEVRFAQQGRGVFGWTTGPTR